MTTASLPDTFGLRATPTRSSRAALEDTGEALRAITGPMLSSTVFLGFSVFAATALGLAHSPPAYVFLSASVLLVYGADAIVDHLRSVRRLPWPALVWLAAGAAGMAAVAPRLRADTWQVVAVYLPPGLLWAVPCLPVWRAHERRVGLCAPRDLRIKPFLLGAIFSFGCIGLAAAQTPSMPVLPLGPHAWLSGRAYAVLVVAYVFVSAVANALTMDAADLHEGRRHVGARGVLQLGRPLLELLWAQAVLGQLVLAMVLALGADNRPVAAAAVVSATYTTLATRAVFHHPSKWLRSLACDFQGIALLLGFFFALVPTRVTALAAALERPSLASVEHWPTWVMVSVLLAALAQLTAHGAMLRAGERDRTCGVPAVALLFSLGWQLNHAFIAAEPSFSHAANVALFVLDLCLMVQLVKHFPGLLERRGWPRAFCPALLGLGVLLVYAWQVAFDIELANPTGEYSACISSMLTSALFLRMGVLAPDLRGQRLSIGVARGLASALYVAPLWELTHSPLLLVQGVLTLALDAAYVCVLIVRREQLTEQASGRSAVGF
jgi:hypothetical protein